MPLIPITGNVIVRFGDKVIARTARAFSTSEVEANGDILIPEQDVEIAITDGIAARSAVVAPDGAGLVSFNRDTVRIDVENRWPDGTITTNQFPRWGDMWDLARLMDVQPQGEGHFIGPPYGDIRRNVVEGGQLLAASLVAAAKTDPGKRVISVQAILSRPAVFDVPLDFEVDVHRAGRQFSTIGVQAKQKGKPISSALVLLDVGAPDAIRHQVKMPDVPPPEECPFHDFGLLGREVRFVRGDYDPDPDRIGPPELHCWVRHREAPAELHLRQALLAQSTSHYTIAASMLPHAGYGEALAHVTLSTGVLTVSLALHEDPPLTDWLLYTNPSIWAGRGLGQGQGQVFSRDGRLIASYTAQVMVRHFEADPNAIGLDSTRLM